MWQWKQEIGVPSFSVTFSFLSRNVLTSLFFIDDHSLCSPLSIFHSSHPHPFCSPSFICDFRSKQFSFLEIDVFLVKSWNFGSFYVSLFFLFFPDFELWPFYFFSDWFYLQNGVQCDRRGDIPMLEMWPIFWLGNKGTTMFSFFLQVMCIDDSWREGPVSPVLTACDWWWFETGTIFGEGFPAPSAGIQQMAVQQLLWRQRERIDRPNVVPGMRESPVPVLREIPLRTRDQRLVGHCEVGGREGHHDGRLSTAPPIQGRLLPAVQRVPV